jgi:hypothetical protein
VRRQPVAAALDSGAVVSVALNSRERMRSPGSRRWSFIFRLFVFRFLRLFGFARGVPGHFFKVIVVGIDLIVGHGLLETLDGVAQVAAECFQAFSAEQQQDDYQDDEKMPNVKPA